MKFQLRSLLAAMAMIVTAAAGQSARAIDIFFDFTSSGQGWTTQGPNDSPFIWSATAGLGGTSGAWYLDGAHNSSQNLWSPVLTATASTMTVTMIHQYNFDAGEDGPHDGGGLLVAINGGTSNWLTPTAAGDHGEYYAGAPVLALNHDGWSSSSYQLDLQYVTSVAEVTGLNPGDSIQFQLTAAFDATFITPPAWQIASFGATNAQVVPEPSTYALAAIATGVMAAVARRRKARRA